MTKTSTISATMRAWMISDYGGPENLHLSELPRPEPQAKEVLIRMRGAEVGDWDVMVRDGTWPMERPFPLVLGLAGSGTVAAVGPSVEAVAVTDRVYVYNYPMHDNGAWAQYMLVPAAYVAHAPESLDLTMAGGVPIAGLTAHETLADILEVRAGEVVLITAAAGGVGHLAVQIAKRMGAHVVATASLRNHEFLRSLGADMVVDYTTDDFARTIRNQYPHGVDKVLNGVAGETANHLVGLLRNGGRMVDLTGTATIMRSNVRIETDYVVKADANRLRLLARMFDNDELVLEVQQVVPFERADVALELVQGKHVRGKVVLEID